MKVDLEFLEWAMVGRWAVGYLLSRGYQVRFGKHETDPSLVSMMAVLTAQAEMVPPKDGPVPGNGEVSE